MDAVTETNKKRGSSESKKTGTNWTEFAIDAGLAALTIASSAFLSGLAAAAGASTYRTLTSERTEPAASEAATVIAMKKNA